MARGRGGFIGQDGLNAPDSPTSVSGTAGDSSVSVAFTAPTNVGGSAITGYRVQDGTKAHGASGTSSPINVTGLTNDTTYTFNVWAINAFGYSAPSDTSAGVTPVAPPLGVFFNGNGNNVIDYVNISTTGNATDWGDHDSSTQAHGSAGSSTRGVSASYSGDYDYITYSSTGNAVNFGTITGAGGNYISGVSSSTRGVFYSANGTTSSNTMEYITIASTGNGTDYGDMSDSNFQFMTNQVTSPTRGLFCGGTKAGAADNDAIRYVTIASTGNDSNFGDLTQERFKAAGASSNTRGLIAGGAGNGASSIYNIIDYVTMASTGNATDFGDLTVTRYDLGGTSSGIRAVFNGGYNGSYAAINTIDYVTIASTGNATDFGDMTTTKVACCAIGPAHGGIS